MKRSIKILLFTGAGLVVGGPCLGLLGTVLGMIWSFDTLGDKGVADMQALSSNVSLTLISTVLGFVLAGAGLLLLVAGLMAHWISPKTSTPPELPS